MTLYTFVVASTVVYGAVVYGVSESLVTLLMAKGRIAPEKTLSFPKLELTTAFLGESITKSVCEANEKEVIVEAIHVCSDSHMALGWIYSAGPLQTNMQNHKLDSKKPSQRPIGTMFPTSQYLADLITLGVSPIQLSQVVCGDMGPKTYWNSRSGKMFLLKSTK